MGDKQTPFPIVGIGASAGGLEALEAFFENLPAESGIAFVVITHTDPKRSSLLPNIINRKTSVPIQQVEDGMSIAPNCAYLPPSDRDLFLEKGNFRLRKRPARDEIHMPVDLFLRHLAKEREDRAGCVILSGTGTDGTHGLRAIKEKSGLTVVQRPSSARHTGMPESAIDTGLVDFVLFPKEMPGRLIEYFKHPVAIKPADKDLQKEPDKINQIISFLANRTRHDFSLYKSSTLKRRIGRRIAVTRSRNAAEYLKVLYRDKQEVQDLFQDLLIGVTSFFRDPQAFAYLKEQALGDMFSRRKERGLVRVWIPGCATGEEVYSMAILLKEYMEENNAMQNMQVFGTDIDPQAIERARSGEYLPNIATDVSAERLNRFFEKDGDRYRVKRDIREPIVFAEQNLLRDPPFSDLDLLVCRNVLIYLKTEAQDKLIPLFHYTLKKNGLLFLGDSETTGRFPDLFEPLSKTHSIFRKKDAAARPQIQFPTGERAPVSLNGEREDQSKKPREGHISLEKAVESILLKEFSPACVVLNQSGEIVFTSGRTGKYLELAPGRPNLNITEMAREGLRFPLTAALRKTKETQKPVVEKGLRVKTNGEYQWVDLTVSKIDQRQLKDGLMVVFKDIPSPAQKVEHPDQGRGAGPDQNRTEELEHELTRLRQEYRNAREELETSNEELRSANEEMQSSNEELQSTNEELESSREELQSLNEELNTVNDELQNKIGELRESYLAVTEALNSTRIAIVFLDKNLCVTRFTRAAAQLINLIDADLGRPIEHISTNLNREDLADSAATVLKTLVPLEDELKTEDGHWFRMNIMVHRKKDHIIDGVVMTFVNIDPQKNAQIQCEELKNREIRSANRFAEKIVDAVKEPLLVLDDRMRVVGANNRFYETFGAGKKMVEGKNLFEMCSGQWDIPELRTLLKQTVAQGKSFENHRVEQRFSKSGLKRLLLSGHHLQADDEDEKTVLLIIEDVTENSQ
jgi:two-component system CheB/CheR fusion protein